MQVEPSDFRGLLTSLAGQYSLSKSEKWGTVMLLGFLYCVVPAWIVGGIFLKAYFGTSELVAFLKHPSALGLALCAAIPGVLFILEHISSIWTISADGIGKKSIFSRSSWTIQSESIAEILIQYIHLKRVIIIKPRMGKKKMVPVISSMEKPVKQWLGF